MEPTIVEVLWFITGETNNISPNSIFNYFQICPDRQTLYEHLSLFRWQKKTLLRLHDDLYGKTEVIHYFVSRQKMSWVQETAEYIRQPMEYLVLMNFLF